MIYMSDKLKKKILEKYLEHAKKSEYLGLWSRDIAKELELDEDEVKTECNFLEDDGHLEKEIMEWSGGQRHAVGVRITSKGKTALQTIYNPDWVKQNNKEKEEGKKLKKREITNFESSLRWTKLGVIGAIVLGAFSLIYTILKP